MYAESVRHTPGAGQIARHARGGECMLQHVTQMQTLTTQTFRLRHRGVFLTDGVWGLVPLQLAGERNGRVLDRLSKLRRWPDTSDRRPDQCVTFAKPAGPVH